MRQGGMLVTTANEARLRADTLLLVGDALLPRSKLVERLLAPPAAPEIGPRVKRRVFCLCPKETKLPASEAEIQVFGCAVAALPALLAALRARLAGRPIGRAPVAAKLLDRLTADLKSARFGVAAWSSQDLDALAIEMLCGLLDDLNAHTRFTGLPLSEPENAAGVLQVCGWMTGFPVRTGFARRFAEHDPWRFDCERLIASGEADCAVFISSYVAALPEWARHRPTIALMCRNQTLGPLPGVHIEVGTPGVDHGAVEYLDETGTLAPIDARQPSDAIPVAQALAAITSALPEARAQC